MRRKREIDDTFESELSRIVRKRKSYNVCSYDLAYILGDTYNEDKYIRIVDVILENLILSKSILEKLFNSIFENNSTEKAFSVLGEDMSMKIANQLEKKIGLNLNNMEIEIKSFIGIHNCLNKILNITTNIEVIEKFFKVLSSFMEKGGDINNIGLNSIYFKDIIAEENDGNFNLVKQILDSNVDHIFKYSLFSSKLMIGYINNFSLKELKEEMQEFVFNLNYQQRIPNMDFYYALFNGSFDDVDVCDGIFKRACNTENLGIVVFFACNYKLLSHKGLLDGLNIMLKDSYDILFSNKTVDYIMKNNYSEELNNYYTSLTFLFKSLPDGECDKWFRYALNIGCEVSFDFFMTGYALLNRETSIANLSGFINSGNEYVFQLNLATEFIFSGELNVHDYIMYFNKIVLNPSLYNLNESQLYLICSYDEISYVCDIENNKDEVVKMICNLLWKFNNIIDDKCLNNLLDKIHKLDLIRESNNEPLSNSCWLKIFSFSQIDCLPCNELPLDEIFLNERGNYKHFVVYENIYKFFNNKFIARDTQINFNNVIWLKDYLEKLSIKSDENIYGLIDYSSEEYKKFKSKYIDLYCKVSVLKSFTSVDSYGVGMAIPRLIKSFSRDPKHMSKLELDMSRLYVCKLLISLERVKSEFPYINSFERNYINEIREADLIAREKDCIKYNKLNFIIDSINHVNYPEVRMYGKILSPYHFILGVYKISSEDKYREYIKFCSRFDKGCRDILSKCILNAYRLHDEWNGEKLKDKLLKSVNKSYVFSDVEVKCFEYGSNFSSTPSQPGENGNEAESQNNPTSPRV